MTLGPCGLPAISASGRPTHKLGGISLGIYENETTSAHSELVGYAFSQSLAAKMDMCLDPNSAPKRIAYLSKGGNERVWLHQTIYTHTLVCFFTAGVKGGRLVS